MMVGVRRVRTESFARPLSSVSLSLYLSLSSSSSSSYIVNSMIALTISPSLAFNAAAAFPLLTFACVATKSTSFSSKPSMSISPSSTSSVIEATFAAPGAPAPAAAAAAALSALNAAACAAAFAAMSSAFASPKMTYVSEFGALKQSGFEMTYSKFRPRLKVTLSTFSTFSMPNLDIAFLAFFSAREMEPV